ncbi:hypothetical protein SDC9_167577 [bioreactor metagenome]|uniref:Uncharacterized protein n=1 Tax=bioreactor metagenome TaxID=1076179 RepID=A0A645G310_9ZZZZ
MRVLRPIRTQSKGVRPIHYQNDKNDLAIYTYLREVAYQVEAHFEWNLQRPDLAFDRNEDKHYRIATRMVEKGGRRDIFLGTRECQGYVEPCVFGAGKGFYDEPEGGKDGEAGDVLDEVSFGVMFHSYAYPDETGEEQLGARFWRCDMRWGVISFPRPEECAMTRAVRPMKAAVFTPGVNFSGADALHREEGLG